MVAGTELYAETYRDWWLVIKCVSHGLHLVGKDVADINILLQKKNFTC